MSQISKGGSGGGGPVPPDVATSYVTDDLSIAIPALNVLNVKSDQNSINVNGGIRTLGSGNTVTVQLTNRITGSRLTTDATLTDIITLPLSAIPATYYVFGNVQAFNASTPASAAYSFSGGYRTDGATAVELGTEFHDTFQDAALVTSDIFLATSGNNILVQIKGVVGLSINWNALLEFRQVS